MIGWENPLLLVLDAGRSAVARVVGFCLACWIGAGVVLASAGFPLPLGCSPLAVPVYWLGGIFFGLADGWGLIAYVALFALLVSLIQADRHVLAILYAAAVIQAAETTRLLATRGTMNWWLYGVLVALLLGAGVGLWWLHRHGAAIRRTRRERRRTGYCVECGYDLRATIRAGGDECPECGAEIPPFTIRSVTAQETPGPGLPSPSRVDGHERT